MTVQQQICCNQDCEIIGIVLAASVVLGALMAAVGSVAAECIIPEMNASQGAVLLGFAGAMTCPFIAITVATVIKIIDSMGLKRKGSKPSNCDFIAVITLFAVACLAVLGIFAAATLAACFINSGFDLKEIPFIEGLKLSGCSLGLAIGLVLLISRFCKK